MVSDDACSYSWFLCCACVDRGYKYGTKAVGMIRKCSLAIKIFIDDVREANNMMIPVFVVLVGSFSVR